jgi:hypothetical protein
MGKVTGFLEIQRLSEASDPVESRLHHYQEFVHRLDDAAAARKARAAWIAVFLFVRTVVRLIILFQIGMIWFIGAIGIAR